MPKQATVIVLSEQEQEGLLQITRRHRSEQQVVKRARIVLASALGHSNAQIVRELGISVDTVRLWRDRWAGLQGIDLETWKACSYRSSVARVAPAIWKSFAVSERIEEEAGKKIVKRILRKKV